MALWPNLDGTAQPYKRQSRTQTGCQLISLFVVRMVESPSTSLWRSLCGPGHSERFPKLPYLVRRETARKSVTSCRIFFGRGKPNPTRFGRGWAATTGRIWEIEGVIGDDRYASLPPTGCGYRLLRRGTFASRGARGVLPCAHLRKKHRSQDRPLRRLAERRRAARGDLKVAATRQE
jgi:hypothetical protein